MDIKELKEKDIPNAKKEIREFSYLLIGVSILAIIFTIVINILFIVKCGGLSIAEIEAGAEGKIVNTYLDFLETDITELSDYDDAVEFFIVSLIVSLGAIFKYVCATVLGFRFIKIIDKFKSYKSFFAIENFPAIKQQIFLISFIIIFSLLNIMTFEIYIIVIIIILFIELLFLYKIENYNDKKD